jgi:hypothetical protein
VNPKARMHSSMHGCGFAFDVRADCPTDISMPPLPLLQLPLPSCLRTMRWAQVVVCEQHGMLS